MSLLCSKTIVLKDNFYFVFGLDLVSLLVDLKFFV